MESEWGPWIEHDGKGCPCVGASCHVIGEGAGGEYHELECIAKEHPCWDWSSFGVWAETTKGVGRWARVIRYRIRKPRALLDLIERAKGLDDAPEGPVRAPAQPKVPA